MYLIIKSKLLIRFPTNTILVFVAPISTILLARNQHLITTTGNHAVEIDEHIYQELFADQKKDHIYYI